MQILSPNLKLHPPLTSNKSTTWLNQTSVYKFGIWRAAFPSFNEVEPSAIIALYLTVIVDKIIMLAVEMISFYLPSSLFTRTQRRKYPRSCERFQLADIQHSTQSLTRKSISVLTLENSSAVCIPSLLCKLLLGWNGFGGKSLLYCMKKAQELLIKLREACS